MTHQDIIRNIRITSTKQNIIYKPATIVSFHYFSTQLLTSTQHGYKLNSTSFHT